MYVKSIFFCILATLLLTGCETAQKATTETGRYIGKGANVVGGITAGGAEAVKGEETSEENPYAR
ncbi:MAG: hypothetical protein JXD21_07350 [Candidatus Omnitrophica bacterium]|nr:hypothetical protein [Candidatus Omnitrophota bacterium]